MPFMGFNSKAEFKAAVQAELAGKPMDEPFESALVCELVGSHHYHLAKSGLRPTLFRKRTSKRWEPPPYQFECFVDGMGWHGVSWVKCIHPPSKASILKAGCRRLVKDKVSRLLRSRPVCEVCKTSRAVHVHHRAPRFSQLVDAMLDGQDPESFLHAHDWSKSEQWVPDRSDWRVAKFLAMHASAELVAVCKRCHQAEHRQGSNLLKVNG